MARLGSNRTGGPRRTAVTRTAYWIADAKEPHWRYLPSGATHRQVVETIDPETGKMTYSEGQYEAKGWVPAHKVPQGDERLKLLPVNHDSMMRDHKAVPIMAPQKKSSAA